MVRSACAAVPRRSPGGLEGDVVVHVVEAGGLRRGLGRGLLARRRRGAAAGAVVIVLRRRAAHALAAAQQLQRVGAHLGDGALVAVLVGVLARAQAALDIGLRTLAQVLAGD